jgi:hypothetical protein
MTYFYELRAFNHKGECFDVREYSNAEYAQSKFDELVSNTKTVRGAMLERGIEPTFLASQMQLVKRDSGYIGLEQLAIWTA